jgi:hypothetical protein
MRSLWSGNKRVKADRVAGVTHRTVVQKQAPFTKAVKSTPIVTPLIMPILPRRLSRMETASQITLINSKFNVATAFS